MLPILPPATLADVPLQEVNYDLGEQIGWPTFVARIEAAWDAIPVDERDSAIVLTGYGEAGAIERFGGALPTPYSGHNTWWWWRTPPDGTTTVLAAGLPEEWLSSYFGEVELVGRLDNGLGVANEEQGAPLVVARAPREPLPEMWSELRHYG